MKRQATSNLKIVEHEPVMESESKRWDTAQEELKITASDARQRVKVLRDELERYGDQLQAVPFEFPKAR